MGAKALCAEAAPQVIRDEQHLQETVERLEELTFKNAIPHLKNANWRTCFKR
jgi:hypothetical protein